MAKKEVSRAVVLGLMSGTSLDGLDLALCEFWEENTRAKYRILKAETRKYAPEWSSKLRTAPELKAEAYFALHAEYGAFLAAEVKHFLAGSNQQPELIASHGHTVFHQPSRGFSTQMGCGATIAAHTGINTACDFRSLDVALGGQGAPLVPVGDEMLFGEYRACLNIGGIANLSYKDHSGSRQAFDICVANMALNFLSEKLGKIYDEGGQMAASGQSDQKLLEKLNGLDFYQLSGAKSLGREWFQNHMEGLLENSHLSVNDLLATVTEHIAFQIGTSLNKFGLEEVLFSGGGALNEYLIQRIKQYSLAKILIPEPEIIHFKEAIIFAFIGFLRAQELTNTFSTVTSASRDSIGGAIYLA